MNKLMQKAVSSVILAIAALTGSGTSTAVECLTNVDFIRLDVSSQTINVTGSGFDAIYNGNNPVITAILAEQAFQPNWMVTHVLASDTCFEGGNIQATDYP